MEELIKKKPRRERDVAFVIKGISLSSSFPRSSLDGIESQRDHQVKTQGHRR